MRRARGGFIGALMAVVIAVASAEVGAQEPERPARPGWTAGPTSGQLGNQAMISVPEGFTFLSAEATKRFLEENENVPDGDELGAVLRIRGENDYWFSIFSFSEEGYVDDSDRDKIDADALMTSMKEGNARANQERLKRGWTELRLEGWQRPPYYDSTTNNLTWSTRVASETGPGINHSVRLLGRRGVMSVQLVADQATLAASVGEFNDLLQGFSYNPGERYAEFRKGDKLAGYGLAALVGGGVAAAAVKSGLLQKFGKVLIALVIAALAGLKKLASSLFGGKREAESTSEPTGADPA